jgi:hypothetical protein
MTAPSVEDMMRKLLGRAPSILCVGASDDDPAVDRADAGADEAAVGADETRWSNG